MCFKDSENKCSTYSYQNGEYKKIQEKSPLYLELSFRLASGDFAEFENDEDDVMINLRTRKKLDIKLFQFIFSCSRNTQA